MTRLELITMPSLSLEQARELLDQYAEGSLAPATARDVEMALQESEALAAEYAAMKQAMGALRSLPRPQPPADMAQRVRAAIVAEQREAALAPAVGDDIAHQTPPLFAPGAADVPSFEAHPQAATPAPRSMLMWVGVASALAVPMFVAIGLFGSSEATAPTGVHAAGVGATAQMDVTLTVPASVLQQSETVETLATDAGLTRDAKGLSFVGPAAAAKRFSLQLRQLAQLQQGDVVGFVPQSGTVRVQLTAPSQEDR